MSVSERQYTHTYEGRPQKTLVLCFDGTGNKFQGTAADSNIVKIFHLLDRQDPNQCHYYQPGIGTYVETGSLARKTAIGKMKSWYAKSKDMAVGSSFGEHVMAGYKFLMRYYNDNDKVYFFGFSRGAYTARFLAQMLDYVGLLTAGNEEMLRFAWKTFAQWQMRTDSTEKEKAKKKATFEFMKNFRETFSRPVCRIEFIGLFDCVNSVPQFETAWMSRTKFPYTANTSAKVIRHAVSIDERRAKFRQDLISELKAKPETGTEKDHFRHEEHHDSHGFEKPALKRRHTAGTQVFRPKRRPQHNNLEVGAPKSSGASQISISSATMAEQQIAAAARGIEDDDDEDQDILEIWFAGQHGDIGGGWTLSEGESRPLSDIALWWMIREARNAGMPFDESKLDSLQTLLSKPAPNAGSNGHAGHVANAPVLQVDGQPLPPTPTLDVVSNPVESTANGLITREIVEHIAKTSRVHDSLTFSGGLTTGAVMAWQFMEYLPFRRMDLQEDGSWQPVSWPLPRGETRDMTQSVLVHNSVIKRMQANPKYRPGNLIVGGGGRGFRTAPEKYGMGEWKIVREPGDIIGEAYVKVPRKDDPAAMAK